MAMADEILVKEKDGTWRVWRDGQWLAVSPPSADEHASIINESLPKSAKAPEPAPSMFADQLRGDREIQSEPKPAVSTFLTPAGGEAASKSFASAEVKSKPPVPVVSPAPPVVLPPPEPEPPDPTDDLVEQIITSVNLKISEESSLRLKSAIRLRLKDVRDTVDTREALRRSVPEGGVGLSDDVADVVIEAILEALPQMQAMPRPTVSRREPELVSPSPKPMAAPVSTSVTPPLVSSKPSVDSQTEAVKMTETSAILKTPTPAGSPSLVTPKLEIASAARVEMAKPQATIARPPIISRPGMVDVRTRPSVVGPIDELRLFTPLDFRRLNADPAKAALRIKEKVKLLEDESYDKMVEGVRAWRHSPLHLLYLTLGRESLLANKSIKSVIDERKAANKETLTVQEFDAIMDLNKNLRF